MVIRATEMKKDASLACIVFACDQWRAYRPPKSATTIQKECLQKILVTANSISVKKESKTTTSLTEERRGEWMVRKVQNEPTRQNHLPAKLVPFSCAFAWTLATAGICHLGEKQGAAETRRRMVTLSQQHQCEAGVFSRHGRLDRKVGF